MHYKRRSFLKLGSQIAAGVVLAPLVYEFAQADAAKKIKSFGLQLYTLKNDLIDGSPSDVLKQVASFGYKMIESYEGPKGMFWGMDHIGFKKHMDDLGMRIVSSHCDINKDFEKKAEKAAAIGMKYLICPSIGQQDSADAYKKLAADFNHKGEICKKNGIRFAYHNHDYSFLPVDAVLGQNVLMDNTDPELVDFELDMYWVVNAGHNIEEWLNKYKNRFRLCHVKDRSKTPAANVGSNSVVLGSGSINWPSVLKTAHKTGMKYFIVEQEAFVGTTPLKAVEANAAYMKTLKV